MNMHESARQRSQPLPTRSAPPRYLATPKQVAFIKQLLKEREGVTSPLSVETMTLSEASAFITEALNKPKVQQQLPFAQPSITREDGMYRDPESGDIWRVQYAVHGSGRLYAKQLMVTSEAIRDDEGDIILPGTVRFTYVSGAINSIRPEWRMTLEEAAKFGALYGVCVRCGRTLTKEKSIGRAMGPVCAKKI